MSTWARRENWGRNNRGPVPPDFDPWNGAGWVNTKYWVSDTKEQLMTTLKMKLLAIGMWKGPAAADTTR